MTKPYTSKLQREREEELDKVRRLSSNASPSHHSGFLFQEFRGLLRKLYRLTQRLGPYSESDQRLEHVELRRERDRLRKERDKFIEARGREVEEKYHQDAARKLMRKLRDQVDHYHCGYHLYE